jgi:hypothetical protein
VTPVIHNWWDIRDQNAQLVELIMFFKVTCTLPPPLYSLTDRVPALACILLDALVNHGEVLICANVQNIALVGALLFYLGDRPRRVSFN